MKKNFKLKIRYDGSRYQGWEHQVGVDLTIQGKLESVLAKMTDSDISAIKIIASGRTDAGVHAIGQIANVHLDTDLDEDYVKEYLNRYLPDDISIDECKLASDRFHARYNAVGKTYRYTFYYGDKKPVFDRKYVTVIDKDVDIDAMIKASKYLVGEHDYKSFCANPRMKKSTVRIVDKIDIKRNGPYIHLYFHGTGFLQNMVRILAGTLLEVGFHKMTPIRVKEIMDARDRKLAGPTAPAMGLCLMEVDY